MPGIAVQEPQSTSDAARSVSDAIQARLFSKKRKRDEDGSSVRFSDSLQIHELPAPPLEESPKQFTRKRLNKSQRRRNAALKATEKEERKAAKEAKLTIEELRAKQERKERKARLKAERRLKKDAPDQGVEELESPQVAPTAKKKRRIHFDESTMVSSATGEEMEVDTAVEPEIKSTPSVGLQRLPRPHRVAAPDRELLDQLNVAEELRDGIQVEPDLTVEVGNLLNHNRKKQLLGPTLQQRLDNAGISSFFAVQAAILPLLLEQADLYPDANLLSDLCVSAPTGSGKTLAYVLPIIEILCRRIVTRLRALIVLPTRDLAQQVREVFETFCKGTDLKVGSAYGQHSFGREQELLVGSDETISAGGTSNVDILLATPGRLLEHLRTTPNFTLQHLRFLVIDEADRLTGHSFGEWLPTVLSHVEATEVVGPPPRASGVVAPQLLCSLHPEPRTMLDKPLLPSVQKLLFSATLSRDPAIVSGLHLTRPIYVAVREGGADSYSDEAFSLPASLKEYMMTSGASSKPLLLFHLLATQRVVIGLCFTKSVQAATRLVSLIESFSQEQRKVDTAFPEIRAAALVSDLPTSKRTKLLDSFRQGEIQLLVCSDLIARGMDLPNVDQVVSYDAPVDMRKYVHRVGRTARAGREGEAWSLLEKQEVSRFQAMLTRAGRKEKVILERASKKDLQKLEPAYQTALESLRATFSGREEAQ